MSRVLFVYGNQNDLDLYFDFAVDCEGLESPLTANNGLEALVVIANNLDLGVVVTGIRFDGRDDFETIPQIKKDFPEIKVIVNSTYNDRQTIEKMLSLGADAYISKSDGPESLFSKVKEYLNE